MNPSGFEGGRRSEAVRVWMLGGFRVTIGSRTIVQDAWRLRKGAALVKLLALAPGHRLHREQAMDLLWPDSGRRAASNSLRSTLHAARNVLDPALGSRYLASEDESLVLCPGGDLWVDVDAFEEAAAMTRRSQHPGVYRPAVQLYAGELLPGDRYEEWTEDKRAELRRLHLALLLDLAKFYEEREEYEPAIEVLRKATAEEPTSEGAHVALMRLHALSGQPGRALAQFEDLCDTLSNGLDTGPGATTRRLHDKIAAGEFPPLLPSLANPPQEGSLETAKHNLPAPRTSFVGRDQEMVEVKRMPAMTRLLTLTGAGGSGKTRLALEVARDLAGVYQDGVWLVELAPLTDEALVPQMVAEILGVHEQPNRQPADTLVDALKAKELLLVLDNCEHLVEACASLVDALLAGCPRLKVLATSRESLGVAGETVWVLSSLSVPHTDRLPETGELTRYDAVRLFVERARLRLPDFDLTSANGRVVAEVCSRLDGMPLAIELATARMGSLAVEEVAQRLEDSLGLLSAGPRTVAPRQRTIRATLEWSHGLLSESEQVLFRRLSVFAGGWTLEVAEAVGSDDGIEKRNILDLLSGLVDKSLVVAEIAQDGTVRYRMLEPVRQFAREQLERSEENYTVRGQHATWYLDLAERAETELKGRGQAAWLARLEEENDNLRAAMAWLLETGELEDAVRLAWALVHFWGFRGHQVEGRRWTEEALAKGQTLPPHARAKALHVQAAMSYGLDSPERVRQLCEEAALLFRQEGDGFGLALAITGMGLTTLQQGDAERATTLLEQALVLFREAGDKFGMSNVLAHLGTIPLAQGNHALAARYLEEAVALSREMGNYYGGCVAFYNLALAAQSHGEHKRSAELYREGLRFSAEAGDKANIAYTLEGLAELARVRYERERATRLLGAAESLLEDVGGTLYVQAQDRSLYRSTVDSLRSHLDEETFSTAWAAGRAMSMQQAAEYALSDDEPAPLLDAAQASEGTRVTQQPDTLTRREEGVAALVARGLTNRRIATELSISEHTVANHVAKILRKLGLDSRSQITAWMVARRTIA